LGESIGVADELITEHSSALKAGVAMVEIGDRNGSSWSHVIIYFLIEEAASPRVSVVLKVPSYPVEPVSGAVWKEPRMRVQQEPSRLGSGAGKHYQVGTLEPFSPVFIEIVDAFGPSALVETHFSRHTSDAQLTVAGGQSGWNDRVVCPVFGVDFAGVPAAVSAADAG
jgi:hypothetical protein